MNNTYGTPAGGYPAGSPGPVGPAHKKKKWYRWGVGATLFGFLVGGGITLAAVSGGAGASAGGTAAGSASSAQASGLNSALSAAASTSATVSPARVRWALGRLRRLGGVHGMVTFRNKTGFHTVSFERGTIQSVSGSDVVIKAPDGTTWTWLIVSDTVVRKGGSKTTKSALSAGETVFAGGPVASGARDARLIVIRPAAPAGSRSSQTSLS